MNRESPGELVSTFVREATIHYRGNARKAPVPLQRPGQAINLARSWITDEAREHFQAIYLDGRNRPIAFSVVSVGTATASLVHPREVFQAAVLAGAVNTIVLHNHPSGEVSPSAEDAEVTRRLSRAGKVLGIRLIDSIIWAHGHEQFFSFREERPETLQLSGSGQGSIVASPSLD